MAAINDHTRKQIMTGVPSDKYKEGWDRIFGASKQEVDKSETETVHAELPPSSAERFTNCPCFACRDAGYDWCQENDAFKDDIEEGHEGC